MKKIYVCSPLGGDISGNIDRVKEYAKYVLECGTAPVVPHFYALILDDNQPAERELGLCAGKALLQRCDEIWVFGDEISEGMAQEIELAKQISVAERYFDLDEIKPSDEKIGDMKYS